MPRYYGGYGQQADPNEMAQVSGNPFYNPLMGRPDWYRGIMSLYANLKGAKEEKEAKRISAEDRTWKKWLAEQELAMKKQQLEQADREWETPQQRLDREIKVAEARDRASTKTYDMPPEEQAKVEDYFKMKRGALDKASFDVRKTYHEKFMEATSPKPSTAGPSDYDKKVKAANAALAKGDITPEVHRNIVLGTGAGELTPEDRKRLRMNTDLLTRKAISNYAANPKELRKEGTIEQADLSFGIRLDFPETYNLARKRIAAEINDDKDTDTVKKYDMMFQFFKEGKFGPTFREFMKGKRMEDGSREPWPSWVDKVAVRNWYDIWM